MDTRECEMRDEVSDDLDPNATPMWPQDRNEVGSQFNVGGALNSEEVAITVEPAEIDQQRLTELTDHSEKGASQFAYLVKHWEYRQANAVRLLKEELDSLSKQKQEVELKTLEVLEEHRFEQVHFGDNADKRHVSIDDLYDKHQVIHEKKCDAPVQSNRVEINADFDTVSYWKQKAVHLEKLLQASMQREQVLMQKLEESIQNMEKQSTPLEELSQMLERADNFIHFILQNAPIVLGHMDKELRYRFIYNHYPSFKEEDLIGKTETEIFSGVGVKESLDFKREVLERGLPGKREITFDTELFGSKTFLIYVEPVFNKAGETIGVNYIGMDITDQVRKREKMAKLREEIAVQKAMETELNRMLHINDETMRAKQMLATMSHEIRSPLSGVISIAELLATTNLDPYQKHLISLMISSGEVVIQLINDILDLSRVESGVMKLEAIKFRPREVVKHVIQTAAASSKKTLMMEGRITKEVPLEVVGDVMRIRQILTNLLSNAIKFTHEGMVGIKLQIVPEPSQNSTESPSCFDEKVFCGENRCSAAPAEGQTDCIEPIVPTEEEDLMDRDEEKHSQQHPSSMVWIRCDVYDTGIGIPEKALPTLFKQYTQVSADHARKYGGTGLGLSICKQLVELMGGYLRVTSKEQCGSTFTFVLPYRVSPICDDQSDDPDELPDPDTAEEQPTEVHFQLQPQTLASYFAVDGAHGSASPSTTVAYMEAPQLVFQPASSCPPESSSLEDTVNPPSKLEEGDCKMETSDRSMPTTSQEVTQSPKKPRILLVEDNKINVMVTKSMMNKLGHVIEVVNNGAEAVRAVQTQSYDLILMDVCMPVMDGLEATRIIREYENTGSWDAAVGAGIDPPMPSPHSAFNSQDCYASDRRIPIIAMTANALAESEEECIENGMDSVVTKPVTFPKLKACLDELFPGTTNPIP